MPPTFDCGVISSSTRPHPDNFISPNAICTDTNSVASSVCPGVSNMIKYFRITSGQCYTMGFRIATHPNPANKVLTVKYKMEESNDVDILLFDSIGNLVKSIKQKKSLV